MPLLHRWANDELLWADLGGWRFPSNLNSAQAWFAAQKGDPLNHRFIIEHRDQVVGTLNLVDLDWKNRHATHGVMLGDAEHRGKGLGRDAVMAIMRYAFDELGLERLDTDIIEYNAASYRMHVDHCGWQEEGRQRRWHYRRGRFWDRVMIGITREDYAQLIHATGYWAEG